TGCPVRPQHRRHAVRPDRSTTGWSCHAVSHAGPEISSGDRLAATLIFSMLAHGVVLLGIGFSVDDPAPVLPTLDVILVQTHSNDPPEKADFLANASQQGG